MVFFERNSAIGPQGVVRHELGRFRFAFWFATATFLLITANTVLFSSIVTTKVGEHIIQHDAQVSSQYVNSIVRVVGATSYFEGGSYNPKAPELEAFFRQVSSLPEVLRANVYGLDRRILWSSDENLIGLKFEENQLLENAFEGHSTPEIETPRDEDDEHDGASENKHAEFGADVTSFIEVYLPIWSADRARVVGAVEVYKSTSSLLAEINSIKYIIWLGSAIGSAVLFACLFGVMLLVRRILAEQEQRLVENEKYAIVGEMTSAVAHGLRNPLAAIRSSAELALDEQLPDAAREPIMDIVGQSDRLEQWIRSFLTQARESGAGAPACVLLDDVLKNCVESFSHQLNARNIRFTYSAADVGPIVAVKKSELVQVLNTLISNAIEAIGRDGEIIVSRSSGPDGSISIVVEDDGPGISPEMEHRLFSPYATAKGDGLGVGLSLAKRILERCGGTIDLVNRALRGVRVTVTLPAAGA